MSKKPKTREEFEREQLRKIEELVAAEKRRLERLDAAYARDQLREPPPGWEGEVRISRSASPEFRRAMAGSPGRQSRS